MTTATSQRPEVGPEVDGVEPRRFPAPTGWTLVALVCALCFVAGAVGWTMGNGRPPRRDSADVGFLYDMRSHHEGAIQLTQIELFYGTDDGIRVFADEIIRFQSYEMGLMDRLLLEWGYRPEDRPEVAMAWMGDHEEQPESMPGIASPEELDALRTSGSSTDEIFVGLMVDHHAAGANMAEIASAEVEDDAVRELAARMAKVQRAEIDEMVAAAARAGLDPTPAEVEFDVYEPHSNAAGSADDHGHS